MKARLDTQWIVGFVDGQGCFHGEWRSQNKMGHGFQVFPEFTIFCHKKDRQILYRVKNFFRCGVIRHVKDDAWCYRIQDQKHLRNILIPFFEKHPLKTKKQQDFLKFRKIILLSTTHSDEERFEPIQTIQKTMERELKE